MAFAQFSKTLRDTGSKRSKENQTRKEYVNLYLSLEQQTDPKMVLLTAPSRLRQYPLYARAWVYVNVASSLKQTVGAKSCKHCKHCVGTTRLFGLCTSSKSRSIGLQKQPGVWDMFALSTLKTGSRNTMLTCAWLWGGGGVGGVSQHQQCGRRNVIVVANDHQLWSELVREL